MTNNKTIFVTGGTGNQGGSVARNLSEQGFSIKALTRNIHSPKAQNLLQLNIQLVKGDLNNAATYREHLKMCMEYSAFKLLKMKLRKKSIKE